MLYRAAGTDRVAGAARDLPADVTGVRERPATGAGDHRGQPHLGLATRCSPRSPPGARCVYFAKAEYFTDPGPARAGPWRAFFRGRPGAGRPGQHRGGRGRHRHRRRAAGRGPALGIYPEGTRSPDGRLHKFRTGVARLALRTGAPVIPVGLVGTDRRPAARRAALAPGPRSRCTSARRCDFAGRAEQERSARVLREVTETVREAVQELSGQDYVDAFGSVKSPTERLSAPDVRCGRIGRFAAHGRGVPARRGS